MSGGNCPETPRQKMIGMMYLFLTAMLAINVSNTVLDGFTMVDKSLRSNNEIFIENNLDSYSKIDFEYKKNAVKFEEAYKKSLEIKKKANELSALIDSSKWKVARVCDGPEGDPYNIEARDNVDAGFEALVFKIVGSKKETPAELIKEGMGSFKNYLIDEIVIDTAKFSTLTHAILKSLDTSDPKKDPHDKGGHKNDEVKKWEDQMFTGIPVGAVMALMSKMQTDIRNTESLALNHLMSQVTASDFKVNDIKAHIIPEKTYLVRGSKFSAKLLLAATDSTKRPEYEVYINNSPIQGNDKGVFETTCNATGKFEVTGRIITEDDEGNPNPLDFDPIEYEVVEPFATVSATKMNVMYAGVENPISISVPGFSSRDIQVSISDGSPLIPSGDGFIATPKTPGKEIEVKVSAMVDDTMTPIGSYPFRVKSLPPPSAFVQYPKQEKNASGQTIDLKENFGGGFIRKGDLLDAFGVVAELLDSDFAVKYKILGFDMSFYDTMGNAKTYSSTNSKFTGEQITQIKRLARGKQFYITNIRAIGPDGISKRLPPIDITIN